MARRIFVHIGTAKSGTTAMQGTLWDNRVRFARAGLTVPGTRPDSHYLATLGLLGLQYAGYDNPLARGAWEALAEEARAAPDDVVISHELLARADPAQAERAIASLAPAQVHVLVTVRHLARQAGSAWQENIRNGQVEGWEDFVASITGAPGSSEQLAEVFWTYQHYPRYLARWAAHVPADRVHVLGLIPGADLWTDFAGVLGLDPALVASVKPSGAANTSLGRQQAELLRLVNIRLWDRLNFREYARGVKDALSTDVLTRLPDPLPIRLRQPDFDALCARHDEFVAAVRDAGYDVDDRLDRLDPGRPEAAAEHDAERGLEPGLALGADVLAAYIQRMAYDHLRLDPRGKARAAVTDLAEARPWAGRALKTYLRGRQAVERRRRTPAR